MTGSRRRAEGEPICLAGPRAEKTISLALQGGGAHGAFTWGVLDALLEDGRLAIEAISGASAGAMNAIVLTDGWEIGGPDGAREHLQRFWQRVSVDGALLPVQRHLFDRLFSQWYVHGTPTQLWLDSWVRTFSPYETNPLDINPLRELLEELIDFDRVRACRETKLFVSATNVWTGKVRIFNQAELTAAHLLASACLPTIFQAVEIEGEPYWDGGYVSNPPLFPLFYETVTDDILLVQINPLERRVTPRTATEIQNRLTEIAFNTNLLGELRAIDFAARLIEAGKLSTDRYKHVLMHRISGGAELDAFNASSRLNATWSFFSELMELGRAAAQAWLAEHYEAIGTRGTLDLRTAYT